MGTQQTIISTDQYVVFRLATQEYALHLSAIERVVRAVAITPFPTPTPQISGMVNVQGRIIPVVSMRKIYGLPERELDISDQLMIARTGQSTVALLVDEVTGVELCDERDVITAGNSSIPGLEGVRVLARSDGALIILHNPDLLPDLEVLTPLEAAQISHGIA